jgi:hypothetical protein
MENLECPSVAIMIIFLLREIILLFNSEDLIIKRGNNAAWSKESLVDLVSWMHLIYKEDLRN